MSTLSEAQFLEQIRVSLRAELKDGITFGLMGTGGVVKARA